MVFVEIGLSESYWKSLEIDQSDIEFLYAYLLEKETPLKSSELAQALITERIQSEKKKLQEKQQKNGEIYLPKLEFSPGEKVQFPAMNWISGEVTQIREGINPEFPDLKVMSVALENGQTRQFAANLEDHRLNEITTTAEDTDENEEQEITDSFGEEITQKLEQKLDDNKDIVRIGDKWFPKSLLIEFNVGHLNLAEAVLDMHSGGPMSVDALLEQIDVDSEDPQELVEFSLNYALLEDPRFDEVGPSGVLQWFLNRLEPEPVREKPVELRVNEIDYDRSILTEDMLRVEQTIDDELVNDDSEYMRKIPSNEVSVILNYPHWRVGSLPLTPYTRPLFPTALETPRVKFRLIDAENREISAWVVRPYNYVYGLREWYEELELMPGSIINIRRGKNLGEVLISPKKKRSNREWIKTLLIGADGGVVFALLKQTITADFNERMAIAVPSVDTLDELWKKRSNNPLPFKTVVLTSMKELAKLNPQGQVHAVELYSAINCVRRCPPDAVFSTLLSNPEFTAVGDLYFRLTDQS